MKKMDSIFMYGNQLHIGERNGDDPEHYNFEETDSTEYVDAIQTCWDVAGTW